MFRFIESTLLKWKDDPERKPIILRGARQTGKSHVIEKNFSKNFSSFIKIDFERNPEHKQIFEKNLDPKRIIELIEVVSKQKVEVGSTLIFFDEVQKAPECLQALRYFYEEKPNLHIIAAGSLMQFALDKISIPVGRVSYLFLTPLSFFEYLYNSNQENLINEIKRSFKNGLNESIHKLAFDELKKYMLIGGMPAIINSFLENQNYQKTEELQEDLLRTFEDDILKYTNTNAEYKYAQATFLKAPQLIGKQFKFTQISRDIKSNYIRQGIELLHKAHILELIYSTYGIPLAANAKFDRYKLLFLDIGLMLRANDLNTEEWLKNPINLIDKGQISEQFIGQQILAHSNFKHRRLYYWERAKRGSTAEIDFLLEKDSSYIPIEVKSGKSNRLKSLNLFLDENHEVKNGIRFNSENTNIKDKVKSYPLYSVGAWLDD